MQSKTDYEKLIAKAQAEVSRQDGIIKAANAKKLKLKEKIANYTFYKNNTDFLEISELFSLRGLSVDDVIAAFKRGDDIDFLSLPHSSGGNIPVNDFNC